MKASTKYLYDVEPDHFDNLLYPEALEEMARLAEILSKRLSNEGKSYTYGSDNYERLYERYTAVKAAKKHNLDLIEHRKIRHE